MNFGRVTIRLKWRQRRTREDAKAVTEPPPIPDEPPSLPPPPIPQLVMRPQFKWHHKMIGLLAVIVCFELGIFLMVFPWVSDWDLNYFSSLPFWFQNVWRSPYFRGAISGLGVLNVWISFTEVFRLRRFSASHPRSTAIN
jgi:hypothetical protein